MPQPFRIPFPKRGINRNLDRSDQNGIVQGYGSQLLPESLWNAVNVVPYDRFDRLRGGQRPGTIRAFSAISNVAITALGNTSVALDPSQAPATNVVIDELFTEYVNGATLNSTGIWATVGTADYVINNAGAGTAFLDHIQADSTSPAMWYAGTPLNLGEAYEIDATYTWAGSDTPALNHFIYTRTPGGAPTSGLGVSCELACSNTGSVTTSTQILLTDIGGGTTYGSASISTFNPAQGTTFVLTVLVQQNNYTIKLNGAIILGPVAVTTHTGNSGFGFQVNGVNGAAQPALPHSKVNELKISTATAAAYRKTYLVAVSGGTIYSGDITGITASSGGTGALPTGGMASLSFGLGNAYIAGGVNPYVLTLSSNAVSQLSALIGTPTIAPPLSQVVGGSLGSGTEHYKITYVTATGETTPSLEATIARSANQLVSLSVPSGSSPSVTGYNVYASASSGAEVLQNTTPLALTATFTEATTGLVTGTASVPSTNTATAGVVPTSCTITALYRDRLVFAAPASAPENFFFSRVGVHTDFDYSQTDPAAAFAGNASTAGHIGDPVTALMPFNDDVLLIGGDHHLWRVSGDPADGGSIDLVSDSIGVLSNTAWTKDPTGVIYFMGPSGLFQIAPGGQPVLMTGQTLNQYFSQIDRSANYVNLQWDRDRQGMYIFVTPVNTSIQPIHVWYDARNQGIWLLDYPSPMGPVSTTLYDDSAPGNRVVLMGGIAGLIQRISATALNDDGNTILSSITLGPFQPGSPAGDSVMTMMDVTLGEIYTGDPSNSFNAVVTVWGGKSAYEVTQGTPRMVAARTYTAPGYQNNFRQRIRGGWFSVTVANSVANTYWSMESMVMHMEGQGKQR